LEFALFVKSFVCSDDFHLREYLLSKLLLSTFKTTCIYRWWVPWWSRVKIELLDTFLIVVQSLNWFHFSFLKQAEWSQNVLYDLLVLLVLLLREINNCNELLLVELGSDYDYVMLSHFSDAIVQKPCALILWMGYFISLGLFAPSGSNLSLGPIHQFPIKLFFSCFILVLSCILLMYYFICFVFVRTFSSCCHETNSHKTD